MSNKIVIIGGGTAAVNAIKAIRELDRDSEINVFQNEKTFPYYRIKLTKNLFDNLEEDKMVLQKKEWYGLNNVNLHLGAEVTHVDIAEQVIALDSGRKFSYDKLLIANGASNFVPPIEGIKKENVYTIRKLSNIEVIKNNIEDKKTVLIIGGGIQGLETAWAFHQHGNQLVVAEVMDRLMPRQLDKRASEILRKAIEGLNIKLRLGTQVKEITGTDKVDGIITKNGDRIECYMVIYSVGIRPNKKLFDNTPVKTNVGIIVSDKMQTSAKNVYAAGDAAEFDGKVAGLWSAAAEQGKTAGYNIAGRESIYTASVPVTMMNAFNISLFFAGDTDENNCDETIMEDNPEGSIYKRLFIKENRIIGAITIGDNKHSSFLKSLIEKKTLLLGIDLTRISVDELITILKNK